MKWRPIIRLPAALSDLITAELYTKRQEKALLQDTIDVVSAYVATRLVHISGGTTMTRDDWLGQANAEMAVIDSHITKLESHQ